MQASAALFCTITMSGCIRWLLQSELLVYISIPLLLGTYAEIFARVAEYAGQTGNSAIFLKFKVYKKDINRKLIHPLGTMSWTVASDSSRFRRIGNFAKKNNNSFLRLKSQSLSLY